MVSGLTAAAAGFASGLLAAVLVVLRRTELVFASEGEVFFFRMTLPGGAVALTAGLGTGDLALWEMIGFGFGFGVGVGFGVGAGLGLVFFAGSVFFGAAPVFDVLAGFPLLGIFKGRLRLY